MHPTEFLPSGMSPPMLPIDFLKPHAVEKSPILSSLVEAGNGVFRIFHKITLMFLLVVMIPVSPFLGFGVALIAVSLSVFKRVFYSIASAFDELLGLGAFRQTVILYLQHRRIHANNEARRMGSGPHERVIFSPAGFSASPADSPIVVEDVGAHTAPLLTGCLRQGYQIGFSAGAIFTSALMVMAAPAVGMYTAGSDIAAVFYVRPWIRSFHPGAHQDPLGTMTSQATALMLEEMQISCPWPDSDGSAAAAEEGLLPAQGAEAGLAEATVVATKM